MTSRFCLSMLLGLMIVSTGIAEDWPKFRNTNGDARSNEKDLLKTWPTGGPSLLWTATDLGRGYSSVSVVGDQLFTIGDVGDKQFAFGLSNKDGSLIWKQEIGSANKGSYLGSRSTPTIDDGCAYCLNTDGVLYCLDTANGNIKWQKDLVKDYGAKMMLAKGRWEWKFSESPLVDGDHVLVTPGSADATMIALNKKTGSEIWKCKTPQIGERGVDGAGYSTIVISHACGVKQYVQLVGRGVIGVDAKTGKYLWGYNRVANDVANISSAVVHDNFVFAATGYQTGAALLELKKSDSGEFEVIEKYFLGHQTFQNHHGGFIFDDGYIYGGHGHKLGLPICIRMEDGEVMWGPKRNRGKASAAIGFADGHLYFRYQNGMVVLIEATPNEYTEKGSFMIPDVEAESWAHPVISGGRLFLKEQDRILCYDISNKSA